MKNISDRQERSQNGLRNGVGEEKTVLCGGRGVCLIESLEKTGKCVIINLQKIEQRRCIALDSAQLQCCCSGPTAWFVKQLSQAEFPVAIIQGSMT